MKPRISRAGNGIWRPRCEGLETRSLMAANALVGLTDTVSDQPFSITESLGFGHPSFDLIAVNDASPTDGAILTQAPTSLGIHFDRPVDPMSLGNEFVLERILADGSTVTVNLGGIEQVDEADPSWVVFKLNQPLAAGNYRLLLSGLTGITGLDGGFYFGDGTDVPLADFSVEQAGVTLDTAIRVGPISSQPTIINGSLDFNTNPQAVDLYRIDLPATQKLWRLGAEISAQRLGSDLRGGLSLFDAQGRVIATATIGRKDAPSDPFLYAGLTPGTYYIGVSAQTNLPGRAGGYDPVSGDPGHTTTTQAGGTYTLSVVADAVRGATTVIGFGLDHADPLDSTPTGFSIQFSGAIQIGFHGNTANASPEQTLEVVDANGRSYPVAGVLYDEANARLTYLFCTKLPVGLYRVRVPSDGGLTDLAGRSPVSRGLPAGILATFRVTPPSNAPDANDLGVIYPSYNQDSVYRAVTLQPGESVDLRYVLAIQDTTRLTLSYEGIGLGVEIINANDGSSETLDPGAPDQLRNALIARAAGVYFLRLTAQGDSAVTAHVALALQGTYFESLLSNGVGQGSALNLRLITPTLSLTPDSPATASSPSPVVANLAAMFPLAITTAVSVPPGFTERSGSLNGQAPVLAPANLFLTVTTSLAGLPSATQSSGTAVAAHNGPVGSATGFGQGSSDSSSGIDPFLADPDPTTEEVDGGSESIVAATSDDPATPARELTPTSTAALLADSIDALARQLSADRAPAETHATAEPEPIDLGARMPMSRALSAFIQPAGSVKLEEARIDPLTIGSILALCAMPFRDRVTRWFGRKRPARTAGNSRRPPSPHHGLSRQRQSV